MYDEYASVYDAIGQGRFGAGLAAWSLQWLAERGVTVARVIDVACGAGDAALVFAKAGCVVLGVDRARPMLEIARGKARDAGYAIEFIERDIRELPTTDPSTSSGQADRRPTTENGEAAQWSVAGRRSLFDLATCFYDSLNYLLDDGDLDRVFAGVAAALRPGGHLIFDLNTEAEYATWDERDLVTYDGRDCLVYNQLSYDPTARLGSGRIVWFVRAIERWWRGEETHVERAWGDAEVVAALGRAGLALVARLAPDGAPASEQAPRVVYIVRREQN